MSTARFQSHTIEIVGIALLLAMSLSLTMIFNMAVLNGGTTTVTIAEYGEATAEIILLNVAVWPTVSVAIWKLHRRYRGRV